MKRVLIELLAVVVLSSCGGKKMRDPFAVMAQLPEPDVPVADSLFAKEVLKPLEADELFDDFIFNYALDKTLQKQRTRFPLPYLDGDTVKTIEEKEWKHDYLFATQNYYTLLFDRESDMELVGDTTLHAVQVEWISLVEPLRKKYYFEKEKGMWMLVSIELSPVDKAGRGDFISFYARFATDSLFQGQHIQTPLQFITIDPDDEFSVLETTLGINQWYAFRPPMPTDKLTNICYGQSNKDASNLKILKVNGIGNGYSNSLYFRKRAGEWQLYKYEDTSI